MHLVLVTVSQMVHSVWRIPYNQEILIADAVESTAGGHWLDGMVVVPGCDKNMPGVLMALGRLNRPGLMVYGGTIKPGSCGGEKIRYYFCFPSIWKILG